MENSIKINPERLDDKLTVVVYGSLAHVIKEHPVPDQNVKRAYRQNQALKEKQTGNPLPAAQKASKTHLCTHKSAHVYAVKKPKYDRNDDHRHGNGEDRREEGYEPKM